VAGAGALGASALDLKGSDTLEGVTKDLLLNTAAWDCGGVGQPNNTGSGGGDLVYVGTGSSNGESAIIAGTQQVAPMSRFLNPSVPGTGQVCGLPNLPGTPGAASQTTAEGIAFALDGLSIVVSQATGGTDACNGVEGSACSPLQNKGLAFDPTANILTVPGYVCPTAADTAPFAVADSSCQDGQYKILNSQDVLRLIYFGLDHDYKGAAQRNCGNPSGGSTYLSNPGLVRAVLVETWGNLFRDPANCTTGGCTRLWRAFRRNDESGTTDAFIALTARKAVCATSASPCSAATVGLEVTVAVPGINQANRASPFCNSRQSTGVQCGPGDQGGFNNVDFPNNLPHRIAANAVNNRSPATSDPPAPPTAPGGPAAFADVNPKPGWDFLDTEFGTVGADPYFTDFQDFDCIRRQCSGLFAQTAQEQVCSARGDMGLVIPIWDPPADSATVTAFANADCATGVFIAASAPPCNGTGATAKPSLCPNGEKPQSSACTLATQNPGVCVTPATAGLDPRCRNSALNFPPTQRRVDARVYNLHVHTFNTTPNPDHPYATVTRQNPAGGLLQAKLVGAFYRIHQDNFLSTARANHMVIRNSGGVPIGATASFSSAETTPSGATGACNPTTVGTVSATRLIGCYAGSADRCSIGYAGGEAASLAGTDALRVNGIGSDPSCIQAGTYPLTRKLYLNTVKGFENVGGNELKLANCFATRTAGTIAGFPGIDSIVTNPVHGFVALDTTPANGTQCVDFNEQGLCGAGSNVNACSNNTGLIPNH
jgi:hypothetical protein